MDGRRRAAWIIALSTTSSEHVRGTQQFDIRSNILDFKKRCTSWALQHHGVDMTIEISWLKQADLPPFPLVPCLPNAASVRNRLAATAATKQMASMSISQAEPAHASYAADQMRVLHNESLRSMSASSPAPCVSHPVHSLKEVQVEERVQVSQHAWPMQQGTLLYGEGGTGEVLGKEPICHDEDTEMDCQTTAKTDTAGRAAQQNDGRLRR